MVRSAFVTGIALVLAACGSTGVQPVVSVSHAPATPNPAPSMPAPTPLPLKLEIPAIGVAASVEPVGVDAAGRLAAPVKGEDVSWYLPGPTAGEAGDAVFAGHLDWYDTSCVSAGHPSAACTGRGVSRSVFWSLANVKVGDVIIVTRDDGAILHFNVTAAPLSVPYDKSPAGLFATSGPPSVSLVTCAGAWDSKAGTYLKRLIVTAALAS